MLLSLNTLYPYPYICILCSHLKKPFIALLLFVEEHFPCKGGNRSLDFGFVLLHELLSVSAPLTFFGLFLINISCDFCHELCSPRGIQASQLYLQSPPFDRLLVVMIMILTMPHGSGEEESHEADVE